MKKVAFISHGHPELSKGGAEVASWNLYKLLQKKGVDCLYIARTDAKSHGGSTFSSRGNEVLLHTAMTEWFTLSSSHLKPLFGDLASLLGEYKPDIVHVHHYAHIGIELFAAIRAALPSAKIVFTLHEFMAICMHNGQMVKRETLKLCHKATPNDCHQCFPSNSPGDFLLRKQYLLDQFSHVDEFVSPSRFLAQRYIDWGLDEDKMHVIENVLPSRKPIKPREITPNSKRGKFAFFGQINPYKGLDVLLRALTLLPREIRSQIHLDVHGANLEKQPKEFREKVQQLLVQTQDCVALCGPYEAEQLSSRIAECDWVVIPSIWWENSPVVIQEALQFGRPLISSNIGGMKEKVEEKAGLTFEVGNAASLAATISKAIEPSVFAYWQEKLSHNQNAEKEHIALINSLFSDIGFTG